MPTTSHRSIGSGLSHLISIGAPGITWATGLSRPVLTVETATPGAERRYPPTLERQIPDVRTGLLSRTIDNSLIESPVSVLAHLKNRPPTIGATGDRIADNDTCRAGKVATSRLNWASRHATALRWDAGRSLAARLIITALIGSGGRLAKASLVNPRRPLLKF